MVSRNKMIVALINNIDDWDLDSLINWCKETRQDILDSLDDDTLTNIYNIEVKGE